MRTPTAAGSDRTQSRGILPPPVAGRMSSAQGNLGPGANGARTQAPAAAPTYRLASPPGPVRAAVGRAQEAGGESTPPEQGDPGVYRLADLPGDVAAPVAVAQSLLGSRALTTQAMQVVEIASAIAGAAMTRVLDNTGDVSWELDQMPRDAVHPDGKTTTPSTAQWQRRVITVSGIEVENQAGQRTFADFEVGFRYNGASVGFVEVSAIHAEDGWAWGLTVKEGITQDPSTYTTVPPSADRFAALKLRFHYRFDHSPLQDVIAIADLTIYGNGSHAFTHRWTQP